MHVILQRIAGDSHIHLDPFEGDPVMRLLDPHRGYADSGQAPMPACRIVFFWGLLVLPTIVLCWSGLRSHDQSVFGEKGCLGSASYSVELITWAIWLTTLVVARRILLTMPKRLQHVGVIDEVLPSNFSAEKVPWLLRWLEWLTRLSLKRFWLVWAPLLLCINFANLITVVHDPVRGWWVSQTVVDSSMPGFLQYGRYEANLAGIWHLGVASALASYLIVIIVRLYVVFSCFTSELAQSAIKLEPTHPDHSGGLIAVGRLALVLSLFPFAAGLFMAALSLEKIQHDANFESMFWLLGGIYVVLGPLLFFLPMFSLRRVMKKAKSDFLDRVSCRYLARDVFTESGPARARLFDAVVFADQKVLAELYASAEQMAVWPFDRSTVAKFFVTYLAPLGPVAAYFWPRIAAYFHVSIGALQELAL